MASKKYPISPSSTDDIEYSKKTVLYGLDDVLFTKLDKTSLSSKNWLALNSEVPH